jgi:hypothetical protein
MIDVDWWDPTAKSWEEFHLWKRPKNQAWAYGFAERLPSFIAILPADTSKDVLRALQAIPKPL